jgi:hypothetical protein
MNRSRFLAAALALAGLLGAAEVRSASNEHQNRLEAFRQKAQKERQALGLDKKALFAKYPTPEVKLVTAGGSSAPGGELPAVPVGGELTLTATGRFVPGSLPSMDCQGAVVVSEKVTESRVEAKVKVSSAALPEQCDLRIISPVSLASAKRPAFRVVGNYQWELTLANGMKARMRTAAQPGTVLITGTSEWFDKGGKSLGTREVKLDRTYDGYLVNVQRTEEEKAASNKALGESGKATRNKDNQAAAAEIQQKMKSECLALPPDKMGPCIQKYTAEMQALATKVQTQAQAGQQKAASSSVGCESLTLAVNEGKVTGKGTACGAPGEVNVTGSFTVTK